MNIEAGFAFKGAAATDYALASVFIFDAYALMIFENLVVVLTLNVTLPPF